MEQATCCELARAATAGQMKDRQADRLYLFSPAPGWTYCGGATIICAESLDDAIFIGNQLKDEKDRHGSDAYCIAETSSHGGGFIKEGDGGTNTWLFVEEFILAAPRPVGLVFTEANYA